MNRPPEFLRRLVNQVRETLTSSHRTTAANTQPAFRVVRQTNSSIVEGNADNLPGFRVTARRPGQPAHTPPETARNLHQSNAVQSNQRPAPRRHIVMLRQPWEDFGWRRERPGVYVGEYRVRNRRWHGKAEFPSVRNGGDATFDIYCQNPPEQLRSYGHRACWHHVGNGWYWIHFNTSPRDLASGILHIEHALAEMVGGY